VNCKRASVLSSLISCLILLFHAHCTYSIIKSNQQQWCLHVILIPVCNHNNGAFTHLSSLVCRHARANRTPKALAIERRASTKLSIVPPPPRYMQLRLTHLYGDCDHHTDWYHHDAGIRISLNIKEKRKTNRKYKERNQRKEITGGGYCR
jgi:hypothetical protein